MSAKKPVNFKDVNEDDWRGILAVIICVGSLVGIYVCIIYNHVDIIVALLSIMMLVINFYYDSKKLAVKQ